jgi:hypothetical protein
VHLPDPILKPTWQPTAPRSLSALAPLPRTLPVHEILNLPIRTRWRSKRPPSTPPRRHSPGLLQSPLSPRRKMLGPVVEDDDEGGDVMPSIGFEDLERFDPSSVVEWNEYVVREKPPGLDSHMSKPFSMRLPKSCDSTSDAPPSILWDTWSKKLDKLMENGMLPARK